MTILLDGIELFSLHIQAIHPAHIFGARVCVQAVYSVSQLVHAAYHLTSTSLALVAF